MSSQIVKTCRYSVCLRVGSVALLLSVNIERIRVVGDRSSSSLSGSHEALSVCTALALLLHSPPYLLHCGRFWFPILIKFVLSQIQLHERYANPAVVDVSVLVCSASHPLNRKQAPKHLTSGTQFSHGSE